MVTPVDIGRRLGDVLDAGPRAVRAVTRIERLLDDRLAGLERRLIGLDATTESLKPQLARNREAVQALEPRMERMLRELEAAHREIDALREEVAELRRIAEPLRGTTERVARFSERLPGRG